MPIRCLAITWTDDDDDTMEMHIYASLGLSVLIHLPLGKMVVISQTLFSDALLWMKYFVFWLNFTEFVPKGPTDYNQALV